MVIRWVLERLVGWDLLVWPWDEYSTMPIVGLSVTQLTVKAVSFMFVIFKS